MGQLHQNDREVRVRGALHEYFTRQEATNGYCSTRISEAQSSANSEIETLVENIQKDLAIKGGYLVDDVDNRDIMSLVQECFDDYDKLRTQVEEERQFVTIETFIKREQTSGAARRETARRVEAAEELRLAAEIAQLKGFRNTANMWQSQEELQRKISDAERAYFRRKMVVSKSSQVASSECRLQFSKVREFFEELHSIKKVALHQEHERAMRRLEIMHRLSHSDSRVKMLEVQIAERVYKKKLQDLNELHIAQNMEEAIYMESMLDLLEKVQVGKENAAKEVFELHVKNLKERQESETQRSQELIKFQADATVEIAKLVASYLKDDKENDEAFQAREEEVEAMERRKTHSSKAKESISIGDLYDTVLWSVVKNHCGLTSSDSDYSSDFTFEEEEGDHGNPEDQSGEEPEDLAPWYQNSSQNQFNDGASCSDASLDENSSVGGSRRDGGLSSAGNLHVKQITREYRAREKQLIKRHKDEQRHEMASHRNVIKALKRKHQMIIESLIENCLVERQNLREKIEQRIADLKERQHATTMELRESVLREADVMQEALRAEDKRVKDVETESFSKAQTLISAQVFHEVRNALSSIIAMSEITYAMKKEDAVSAEQLVSSVEDMLEQIKEVVDYALKMLNNVLDISKITSGTFQLNNAPFDLQDLVARATKMQLAKARTIKMRFDPSPEPLIAFADADIVVRIVTNLISNAIKFTAEGGVQPFVCPIEDISVDEQELVHLRCSHRGDAGSGDLHGSNEQKRLVAVGVADTGTGLLKHKLEFAETAVSPCETGSPNCHGARNSGFGLYLIQLLAKSLGSSLCLTSLEKCRKVLNADILAAIEKRQMMVSSMKQENSSVSKLASLPGRGTVLYVTLPVYDGGDWELRQRKKDQTSQLPVDSNKEIETARIYNFVPRPRPHGMAETPFRIMVADDVLMLRKGVLHTLSSVFVNCPVSISTACTAEDMLRAVQHNPFDMIICDNLFHHDASKLRRLSTNSETARRGGRPRVLVNPKVHSKKEIRENLSAYFADERFTLEEGDGEMTGFEAMMMLAHDQHPRMPTPILMVLSGNCIEIPDDTGIIFAQKPLKLGEFVTILEKNAPKLIRTGMCIEEAHGSSSGSDTGSMSSDSDTGPVGSEASMVSLVNGHGTQIFVSQTFHDPSE